MAEQDSQTTPPGPATPAAPIAAQQTPVAAQQRIKLAVENISVTYLSKEGDPVPAVDDVSFTIVDKPGVGEVVVFLGPSGCGKSTILKCLAGLLEPNGGKMLLDGQPIVGTSADRGMVFQAYTSFAWLTVQSNVEYPMRLRGVPHKQRVEKARAALQQVGLIEFAKHYPRELSGGMKQRLAIARTLVNEPRLLLMDEPFGALDPQTRWSMQSLLLDISRKVDNTILFVTHDVSEAVYLADTIYVLSARPAKVLHRLDVPFFGDRDNDRVRKDPRFRDTESKIQDLLRGQGNIRLG